VFIKYSISGLTANEERCQSYAENSTSIVTVLNPHIGYLAGAEIAKEYLKSGKPIRQLVLEKKLITPEQLEKIFDLRGMTEPGIHK
jgi:aspartate ammonia-lyase